MSDKDGVGTLRSRLANSLAESQMVEYAELEEYVDTRYGELQEQIMATDLDKYEDQLNVVAWKGQQEELVDLLRHFEGDDSHVR